MGPSRAPAPLQYTYGSSRLPDGVERHELLGDPVYLILPAHHPVALRHPEVVPLAELAGEAWASGHVGMGWEQMTHRTCRQIGGFDTALIRNQDYDFDYRYSAGACGRLLLDPSIVVDWAVRETPRKVAKQYFEYGLWKARVVAKHPRSLHLRWLVPPGFVATVLVTRISVPGRRLRATEARE